MGGDEGRSLAEWFDQLSELDPAARAQALAGLPQGLRESLAALLAADAADDDPLAAAIDEVALHVAARTGQRLGAWRVLGELGAGGMGTVLLAERDDGQYRQRAAIKLLRGFPTVAGIRRLRQERQILAGLDHAGIARLLDGGETADGQPFVVMEYIEGQTLLRYVAAAAPALVDRLVLFERIAAAVEYAHRNLVIHRDLKPSNVMVRDDGTPKLLDFGVAKLLEAGLEGDAEQTATIAYSPGYASPEQRRGVGVSTASDVYSLGVMLREMLAGPATPAADLGEFPVLAADTELRGILEMATAEEPAKRYPSVEALRDDALRYLQDRPLRAAPDTTWYRARKFLRRNRWSSAAALLALLAAGTFVWRLGVERDRALAAEAHAIEQGAAAARAATTARRTLDYVVTIFGRANPERVLGRELTPRQLVDEAAQELELRLADEPSARRAMQAVLGQVYGALGESREALELLDSAVEGYRPDSREDALWLADVLSQRASAAFAADDLALASSIATASAELREKWAAGDSLQRLRALGDRARAATFGGDSAAALRLWNEAVAAARASADVAPELVDEQLLHLGAITSGLGAYQAADEFTAELLVRLESRLPARHPAFIEALRQRGFVLSSLGRHAESEAVFERALAIHREVLGDAGMTLSTLENDFGASLTLAGRFGSATRHMEKSVELMAAALGGEQFVDGVTLSNLGSTQEAVGDYRGAVLTMALAVQRLEQRRSPDDTEVWKARANYARALAFTGETLRAVALMREVIAAMQRIEGDESLWAAFNGIRLAQIERLAGDLQASRRTLEEAAPRFAKLLPSGHPALAQVHRLRGRLALETGDIAQARAEFETARGILAAGEAVPIDLAMIDVSLASVAMAEGRPDTARELLQPCLPVLRAEVLPGEVNRAEAEALARRLSL